MRTFFVYTLLFMTILLFGILLGMYEANKGAPFQSIMEQTESNQAEHDAKKKAAAISSEQEETVLEESEQQWMELAAKQQEATKRGAFNFYSELGNQIGSMLQRYIHSFISTITTGLHQILNGS